MGKTIFFEHALDIWISGESFGNDNGTKITILQYPPERRHARWLPAAYKV